MVAHLHAYGMNRLALRGSLLVSSSFDEVTVQHRTFISLSLTDYWLFGGYYTAARGYASSANPTVCVWDLVSLFAQLSKDTVLLSQDILIISLGGYRPQVSPVRAAWPFVHHETAYY